MLELAKSGISTSDIMGGALSGTLTLAAAGSTDLATASTIASNAMNTFGLKGKNMASIAAALAGGANASSASVESLGEGLSQVGPGAKNAGLSLQETVAALSAFDAAGIKGSDAGTSLKQMLSNLIPTTDAAKAAMEKVGLWTEKGGNAFVKANGQFKSMAQISGLLHDKLSGLSEAQRSQALTAIFGSDASRAASVLMNEGAKGIKGYIKATKDQTAAEKMAKANMSGTAGALERMQGSIETAGLAFGKLLAPAVVLFAGAIGGMANHLVGVTGFLSEHKGVALALVGVIGALTAVTLVHNAAMAVGAAGGMTQWLTQTKLISAATKMWTAVQWAMNAAMSANPIGIAVVLIAALVAAIVIAWKKSDAFRAAITGAWNGIKKAISGAVSGVLKFLRQHWPLILGILTGPIGLAVLAIAKNWDKIKAGASSVVDWIKGIPGKIGALGGRFGAAGKALLQRFIDGMKNAAGIIKGIAGNVWNAVKGLLNGAIDKINAALEFSIDKGPIHVSINPPDIPHLATGGRATKSTIAEIGEGREPESVLPDSVLRGLLERVHESGRRAGQNERGGDTWNVYGAPGMDENILAEAAWYKTRTRG
jgi:TP901 family phage tail tape measure protein